MESASTVSPLTSLTPELKTAVQEDTFSRLRNIIGANVTTRYASLSFSLADFRQAMIDKNIDKDETVVDDFCDLIPLTHYGSYHPFITKFWTAPASCLKLKTCSHQASRLSSAYLAPRLAMNPSTFRNILGFG